MRRSTSTPAIWPGVFLALLLGGAIVGTQYGQQLQQFVNLGGTQRTSGTSYELKTVTAEDGADVVARWNPCQTAITYKVNLAAIPSSDRSTTLDEITASFKKLHAATGMDYRFKGTTSFIPTTENLKKQPAEIVVVAAESTDTDLKFDGALGFGGIVWSTWKNNSTSEGVAIQRGYVVLSPSGLSTLKPGFGTGMTQGNLILHELGHATGLEHAGSDAENMYAELSDDARNGYGKGDLEGLALLGTDAGCIKVPGSAGLPDLN